MKDLYLEIVSQIERLHRLFLDVVSKELAKMNIDDINNVQALILYNIGENRMTIGELTQRGYYLGSNVSYNIRKLSICHYITQEPSEHDRRSSFIKASERGLSVFKLLDRAFHKQAEMLSEASFQGKGFDMISNDLKGIEIFWRNVVFR